MVFQCIYTTSLNLRNKVNERKGVGEGERGTPRNRLLIVKNKLMVTRWGVGGWEWVK